MPTLTLSPALTETMARLVLPNQTLPSMPRSAPFFERLPGWAAISDSAHFSNSK